MNYHATWSIDVDADSQKEAAALARAAQLKEATPESPAFFQILSGTMPVANVNAFEQVVDEAADLCTVNN